MKNNKALERHTSAVIANAHTSLSAVALRQSIPSEAVQGRAPARGEVRIISNVEIINQSKPVSNELKNRLVQSDSTIKVRKLTPLTSP